MKIHDISRTYGEIDQTIDVGLGIELLYLVNGEIRFAHTCKLIGDDERLRCAPLLHQQHIVTPPPVTITPSLLCDDCGLHGWITASTWSPA